MRHLFVVLLLAGACAAVPAPKAPKPVAVSPDIVNQSTQEVTVVFKSKIPTTISLKDLQDQTKWVVVVQLKGGLPVSCHPDSVSANLKNRYAILKLPPSTLAGHLTSLLVSFDSGPLAAYAAPAKSGSFSAASGKTDSDNYLSGTYSPAFHSAASYTIDAKGSLDILGLLNKSGKPKPYLGATAAVATDNRPSADPDSFLVSGLAGWVLTHNRFLSGHAQGVLLNWDFAGLEFDRQTTTKTFISSPIAEIPVRLSAAPNPGTHFFLGMFPYFGIETGTNLSNAINPNGSGFVLRGVAGSSASLTEKTNWKYLPKIGISANYTARIPTTNEIFTNTHYISATGKTVSLPVMSSQVRHHVTDELDLTIAKPFSISIKHEYGELPPGFRTVDNKVTIGLTIMLKQNGTPLDKVNQNLTPP
jgi:hypothetical protein